ncbi:hypothetical protein KP509_02G058400 [Ceratopteris richardii]|nr:hypothetical protein KP509_02G058400 [Ceratopteris richardii]
MNRLSSCNMSDALNTEDETQHNLIVFLEEDVTGHDAAANELGRNSVPVPGLGKDCGARPDAREDYDEGIVNLPSGAMTKGSKQKKSVEHVFSEESPTKKVRFHESNLGDSPAKGCKPLLKKSLVTSVKRKNINEIVDQGIAKRKLLTANEKPGHSAERTCSFGVGIPPIRKRKRADVSRALQKIYPEDKKQTIVNLSRGEDPGVKNSKGVTLNKKRSIPVGRTSAVSVGISLTRKRKRAVYSEISHEETEQMIVELIQTEGRGVKRRRTLTLNETTAVPDGRTCTNGMSGCLIKKRNVADESGGFPKITEYESNVPKVVHAEIILLYARSKESYFGVVALLDDTSMIHEKCSTWIF